MVKMPYDAPKPFDAAALLEEEIAQTLDPLSTLKPGGTRYVDKAPLQRLIDNRNLLNNEPRAQHDPASNPPPRQADVGEVGGSGKPTIVEDAINPVHYRSHPSGVECIEITRHMNFNTGNVVKYIWRYMDKGDPVENLKKAQWYLDDEIRRLEGLR